MEYIKTTMFWAILVSLIVLGMAYLLKDFMEIVVEPMNAFFVIIGIFLIIYVGATIFVFYNTKAYSAERTAPVSQDDSYGQQEPLQPIDLSTGP
jgi:hypothetical protein